jgi:hypothetical protein
MFRIRERLVQDVPRPARNGCFSSAQLPLTNMSGDPEQEFFADGMTDDINPGDGKPFSTPQQSVNAAGFGTPLAVAQCMNAAATGGGSRAPS